MVVKNDTNNINPILHFILCGLRIFGWNFHEGATVRFPEKYRSKDPLGRDHKSGDPYGFFIIPFQEKNFAVIADASPDVEWEHVSVSMKSRCPTWEEMCFIKSLFFEDNEWVVQFHPARSDYVNISKTCLHLWKFKGVMPTPPKALITIQKIRAYYNFWAEYYSHGQGD